MVGSGGSRVSIPASTRKTIQKIKEITAGNYSEDEIHTMLQECDMNPDETIQRLLLQDPFHEVKNKRDKRKENLSNKDSVVEPQWRSGGQGRGGRGGRIPSRQSSHDGIGAKNSFRKENGSKPVTDPSASNSQDIKTKEITLAPSLAAVVGKSSVGMASNSPDVHHLSNLPPHSIEPKATSNNNVGAPSSVELSKNLASRDLHTEQKSTDSLPLPRPSSSEARFTSSTPTPKPVSDQHTTHNQQHIGESKFRNRSRGSRKTDAHVPRPTSSHSNSTGSRPSSNYSNRSHQTMGSQKGTTSTKEWKPKPVNHNTSHGSGELSTAEILVVSTEASGKDVIPSAESASSLERRLEDLQIQRQHVIIPEHILVPEAERTKLSFGSFDAGFSITSSSVSFLEDEKRCAPLSQNSQEVEGEEFSHPTVHSIEKEEDSNVYSDSPLQDPNDMAGEDLTATNAAPEYDISKQEIMNQNSFDHVPSNFIGLAPQAHVSQLPQFDNADPQARDAVRIPNFMVQQPYDTANYYPQFYRPGPDSDGRVSPFVSPGIPSKFNGNVSTQVIQEGGNSLIMSTTSPMPPLTQAAGMMQSSIPVTQQHVPVFRPHMPHYPPNYMTYSPYFSHPFYHLPPPQMHQFVNNGAFPQQQPQASGVYPGPPPPGGAAATGGKYSLPHYKAGTNTGHVGSYGPPGNSTSNEDLNTLQLKENNGYNNTTGQQSEALPVWVTGPGREVPSSFYGLQHHGQQHVAYAPPQGGHVTFPGMYHHPGQGVTATGGVHHHQLLQQQSQQGGGGGEMVAPNVFQQQQPQQQTQMQNWPSNY